MFIEVVEKVCEYFEERLLKVWSKSGQRSRFVLEGPVRALYIDDEAKGDEEGLSVSAVMSGHVHGTDAGKL